MAQLADRSLLHQRSAVRIQSFCTEHVSLLTLEKTKMKKKEAGNGPFKKDLGIGSFSSICDSVFNDNFASFIAFRMSASLLPKTFVPLDKKDYTIANRIDANLSECFYLGECH